MPSGRASNRQRRPRRGEPPANPRGKRVRGTVPASSTKRPSGKSKPAARPRPRSSSTGGAFKLSSTRHAAVLAMVVCAMVLSVSVPLRTYLSQRAELAAQEREIERLSGEIEWQKKRKAQLSDPVQIEAEARERLGMVRPGETPYIVQVPPTSKERAPSEPEEREKDRAWYERLWAAVTGADR